MVYMYNRSRGCLAFKNCCSPLDEFKGKNEVSTVSLPLLFAVTLSIITLNIYTRLAACNCISITFWSGDLPSPLMAIFLSLQWKFLSQISQLLMEPVFANFVYIFRMANCTV